MAKATNTPAEPKAAAPVEAIGTKKHYQEWVCEITTVEGEKKVIKNRIVRERVMITDEIAEELNNGVLYGSNKHVSMYYPA